MALKAKTFLLAISLVLCGAAHSQTPSGCHSAELNAAFTDFGRTGRMPMDLGR